MHELKPEGFRPGLFFFPGTDRLTDRRVPDSVAS